MLRQYQHKIIDHTVGTIKQGSRRPCIVAPTGSGKTHIATAITQRAVNKRNKVLFLAPRRELIYQTLEKFQSYDLHTGMIMAGEPRDMFAQVQVASFDTLHARAIRSERMLMPEADVVLVDEAHLSMAKGKLQILNHYKDKIVIGLTATPARSDGTGLGEFYDSMVNQVSVKELTEQGYLVPAEYYAPSEYDLSGVRQNKSDYVIDSLAEAVDKPRLIGDIYENWRNIAGDKQTVIFCTNRAHSRHVCEYFVSQGIKAEHVDGETDLVERADIMHRVRTMQTQVLCNVFVASYGLDIPSLECCVLARPTKNIALYLQTVGRVLRPSDGKRVATVIDHTGAVKEHGFVDDPIPWTLEGEDIRELTRKQKEENYEPKEIKCPSCKAMIKAARVCPKCGHEMIPKSEALPVHKAELKQVQKANKEYSKDQKSEFFGMLKHYGKEKGYAQGWASNTYRDKFGVWPNHYRGVPDLPPNQEVMNFIKHKQIAYSYRRKR